MSIVWVVRSDYLYSGDTIYSVCNSKKRAETLALKLKKIHSDIIVEEFLMNNIYNMDKCEDCGALAGYMCQCSEDRYDRED